jgi:hypothetical protein
MSDLAPLIDALDGIYANFAVRCGCPLKAAVALAVYATRQLADIAVDEQDPEAREVLAVLDTLVADGLAGRLASPDHVLH